MQTVAEPTAELVTARTTTTRYTPRLAALREKMMERGVQAVVLVPGTNMHYFLGLDVHLSERPILAFITPEQIGVVIPLLELPKVTSRPDLEAEVYSWTDENGYMGAFGEALERLNLRGGLIGIDGMTMRATEYLMLQSLDSSLQVRPVERDLIGVRAVKQPDEVEAMRRAIAISEAALEQLLKEVRPGMTERQIAARLDTLMLEGGGDSVSFPSLVQTGGNSSNPHGSATDRVLQEGEFLLIDYGCKVDDYPADITRTVVIGQPTSEMQRIYDTVLAANEAAKAAAGPGVPMAEVDLAARRVIEAAGYGEYFTHRTGHGLGLDVHEPIPQIASNVEDELMPGMVFTIEPGIYVPGLGGVRIEDDVRVTDDGLEVLTAFRRTLSV